MPLRSYLFFILLLLTGRPGNAQDSLIDSLWRAVERAATPELRVDELNYLAEHFHDIDPQETINISRQALRLANEIGYGEGRLYAFNNLGTAYDGIGQGDSAFYYFDQARVLGVELDDGYGLSVVQNNFGLYYLFRGNYPLALKYFQESLVSIDEPGYYMDPVVTYNNIGVIHEEQGNLDKAIEYYRKAGNVAMEFGDAPFAYLCYGYIAQIQEAYGEAIGYYEQALKIYQAAEDELHIGESLYYLGECHLGLGEYSRARELLQASLDIYHQLGMVPDEVEIYRTMAEVYEAEGNNEAALALYHQAAELGTESDLNTILVPVFEALARQYALKEDYKAAYSYQLRYQELNDTIYNNETKERIAQLETSYELEVNKAERERLQAEQGRREVVVRQRTIIAVASTLVTILLAILLFVYYRANRQEKELNRILETKVKQRTAELEQVNNKLLESNEELERFTYIASHDLKEPLRNITSFVNLIQRRLGKQTDSDLGEYMDFVIRNTRQMYYLIEDVLNFSRIAAADIDDPAFLEPAALLLDIEASLNSLIREKNALIEVGDLPAIKAHKTHAFILFKNLIENAIKYNDSEQPVVRISCKEEGGYYIFAVADNGIGIAPEYHEQIFEMFRRIHTRDRFEGTGIGLATCKKIAAKYGGDISLESTADEGSIFYVKWPKGHSGEKNAAAGGVQAATGSSRSESAPLDLVSGK